MMLTWRIRYNVAESFLSSFCILKRCSSSVVLDVSGNKYGYKSSKSDSFEKRDKTLEGSFHIGMVNLPAHLKDSLELFYKGKPRKQITNDGLRLFRHLRNRGRPSHTTWTKYKSQIKGKKTERSDVKAFSLNEAVKAGLVDEELVDEEEIKAETPTRGERMKRPQLAEYSMVRYGARETNAYVASQLPSVYGGTLRALSEIKKRLPGYEPRTVLDFGSGSGMSVWAANELWGNSINEYQCVDVSEDMNNTAEFLLRGSSDINTPLKIPNVYFKRFLPLSNQVKYDIVIASHTLTEMPFRSQRIQAIRSLWQKTNDFLVIVEPGNNEGFDTTLQARQFITQEPNENDEEYLEDFENLFDDICEDEDESGHIFAPCPHEMACARSYVETRDHPCNFVQKVQLSFSQRNLNSFKKYGYFQERFSFLILRKGENTGDREGWTRVLQPIKNRHRHVICELCCSNGNIEKHIITKGKDPYIYKAARHCLKWGDIMPLGEAKRPMNIRKAIPPGEE